MRARVSDLHVTSRFIAFSRTRIVLYYFSALVELWADVDLAFGVQRKCGNVYRV